MKGYLSNKKLLICSCFTVSLYAALMYHVQILSNADHIGYEAYNYMSDGWMVFNRRLDNRDMEWSTFKELIQQHWHWFLIHLVSGELTRFIGFRDSLSLTYFVVGAAACLQIFNFQFFLAILLQTMISYGVGSVFKEKRHIWTLAALWLVILNMIKSDWCYATMASALDIDESRMPRFVVIFAWCILKNTSFNLERIASRRDDDKNTDKFRIIDCLGYIFWLPTFHYGPFFLYTRFMSMLSCLQTNTGPEYSIGYRSKQLVLQLARFFFWFVVLEISLHFFYINYIAASDDVRLLSNLALAGTGFLKGVFFNIKYMVFYGCAIAIGEFEHIPMPNVPKCICRVNKFSDMWRWFDHGLYEFLFKYVYTQLTTRSSPIARKIFASIVTFVFIYIWHGLYMYILIWCAANFVCVIIEKLVYGIIDSETFKAKALVLVKTDENVHVLRTVIAANVMIPAIMSNAFFFGGINYGEWGMECLRRTYAAGFLNYLKVLSSFCFMYPVAEAIKIKSQSRIIKNE